MKRTLAVILGAVLLFGCANSSERTAKIGTDTALDEIWTGEQAYAKNFNARQEKARAAKDLATCDALVIEQGKFDEVVQHFQAAYKAALLSYLAVKDTSTNGVSVEALSNFSSDFGGALTNLQTFIKSKR
jgi:outer membrane murein-binding lipoprotein Lpp